MNRFIMGLVGLLWAGSALSGPLSDRTALTGANTLSTDIFMVIDLSASAGSKTKKQTASELAVTVANNFATDAISGDDIEGGTIGSVTITTLTLGNDLTVANGGTGISTCTDGGFVLGSGGSALTCTAVLAKGTILIGDGSTDPTALVVGSNDQVLTADSGEATGVKWAAAGGGSATKEMWIPITMQQTNVVYTGQIGGISQFPIVSLGSGASANITFRVPDDYSSTTTAVIVVIPDATETIQYDSWFRYSAEGEDLALNTEIVLDATQAVTSGELTELDVSALFTFAAGDYVGYRFVSNTSDIRVVGLWFKY